MEMARELNCRVSLQNEVNLVCSKHKHFQNPCKNWHVPQHQLGILRQQLRDMRERWSLYNKKMLSALRKSKEKEIHSILEAIEDCTAEDEKGK